VTLAPILHTARRAVNVCTYNDRTLAQKPAVRDRRRASPSDKTNVKIYTKTGDAGETGLLGGTRVSKAAPRVAAYGDVDELNAWIGFARATADGSLSEILDRIQRQLFAIGARLADPVGTVADRVAKTAVSSEDVGQLERWIDALDTELPPLRRFILAGGTPTAAALHVARTVCRRAERGVVALGRDAVESDVVVYLNRLSDLLFVMARAANHRSGVAESEW
jgi:cob(I)alamin adenosyltransferase